MASAAEKNLNVDRDDASDISSVSSRSTVDSAVLPPLYSSLSTDHTSSVAHKQIVAYLELECDEQKDQIIAGLLINGRQSLQKYREAIIPEILSQEEGYPAGDESPLLKLIKEHITETWEVLLIHQPTVSSFIADVIKENSIHFDNVLTRTAEYGSTYMGASSILSLVLQLLSEGIDDEAYLKTDVFVQLWNSITIQGIHGIENASQDIPEEELREQIRNKKSPLYSALHMYFEEQAQKIFTRLKIPNRKGTLYDLAIDSITEHGWLKGIESIKTKITGKHYDSLDGAVQVLIQQQMATDPAESKILCK